MTISKEDTPKGLMALLKRLRTFTVQWNYNFVPGEDEAYEVGTDREVADLDQANVVSSQVRLPEGFESLAGRRHVVAIDIDHQAWLIPSSTEGHSHLYIDHAMPEDLYFDLLNVLARCGIIEHGYAEVSKKRGHSDLRLPWVSKADQKLATEEEMIARQQAVMVDEIIVTDSKVNGVRVEDLGGIC